MNGGSRIAISANASLILGVLRRFAAAMDVTDGDVELEAIARVLAAQIPGDGIRGLLTVPRAAEAACKSLGRRLQRGALDDRREYLRRAFRAIVRGEEPFRHDEPAVSPPAPMSRTAAIEQAKQLAGTLPGLPDRPRPFTDGGDQ